ncbi:MAG: NAD-dependent epimerase/dehydratase family protein [Betaproteobacteria bacterium]|nr:NAD-dependent epimerase/dehydratase family protein [Betaproteobacteria bacterium]
MHVLVTGGAGFIGSHTVDRLLGSGAHVRVLDDFSSGRRENLAPHPALEVVTGDIRDQGAVDAALAGMSHVLHLAAQVSVATSVEAPLESASVNLSGFLNVLDGARRHGVRRFVYASSAAVYGVPERLPLGEDGAVRPISPYGLEKSINDQYGALYRELYGVSTLGMRYFNVFGPRQDPSSPYSGVISVFVRRLRDGQGLTVNGDGGQTRDFIYVADVAQANVAALASDSGGVCNVATGSTVTLLQLIDALAGVAGVRPAISHGPARAGDIRHSSASNERLRTALGINGFTGLAEGLARLWATA